MEDVLTKVFHEMPAEQVFFRIGGVLYPSYDVIVSIHKVLVSVYQGVEDEIRVAEPLHVANIEFAIKAAQYMGVDGSQEAIIRAKAACLLERLCTAHGFYDGNKRTAYVTFILFLMINGCAVHISMSDYLRHVQLLKRVSSRKSGSKQSVQEILHWLDSQKLVFGKFSE